MNSKKVLLVVLVLLFICGLFGSDAVAQKGKPAKDSKATEERDRVEVLIEQLRHKDAKMRMEAAEALGQLKDPRAVKPLIVALKDTDIAVQEKVLKALVNIKAVELLISLLNDKSSEVRGGAAWALGEIKDPRAVEPLITALKDKDPKVRTSAAWAFKWLNIKDPRTVEPLITALKDSDAEVRRGAAWALADIEDPRAVEPLIAALKDKYADVADRAAESLGRIKDPRAVEPLITILKDKTKTSSLRCYAAEALREIKDPRAVEPLISALITASKHEDHVMQSCAVHALGEIKDPRAVEPLMSTLKFIGYGVQEKVVEALVNLKAVEPLIVALKDKDRVVRWGAIKALGQIKDPRAVMPLISALKDEDNDARAMAAKALGEIEDPRAVVPLSASLKDQSSIVRARAAEVLIKLKAVEPFIAALKDKDKGVRTIAASALGELKDPRAVEPLIAALKDQDELVGWEAAKALGKIKNPRAVEPLILALKDKNRAVRRGAIDALGEIEDPRAVMPLIDVLKNDDWVLSEAAANALGKIKHTSATKPLIAILMDGRLDHQRHYAAIALGYIRDPKAVEPLISVLALKDDKDSVLRRYAAEALGKIKDPHAVKPLIAALKDKDTDVRIKAALALGEIKDQRALEPLLYVLGNENKYEDKNAEGKKVSDAVIESLKKIDLMRVIDLFSGKLKDKNPFIREYAAWILGKLKDARGVEPLIQALKDENERVREMAVWSLLNINDPRAATSLSDAIDEQKDEILKKTWKSIRSAMVNNDMPESSDECKEGGAVEYDLEGRHGNYFYIGKMGEKINFQMEIEMVPNMSGTTEPPYSSGNMVDRLSQKEWVFSLKGKYRYRGKESYLNLSGIAKTDGSFELIETMCNKNKETYAETCKETGRFQGKFSNDFKGAAGKWTSADGKRSFDFVLTRHAIYKNIKLSISCEKRESEKKKLGEIYTVDINSVYPHFDVMKIDFMGADEIRESFTPLSAPYGGDFSVEISLFSPWLMALAFDGFRYNQPEAMQYGIPYYAALIYVPKNPGSSEFKRITLHDLVGEKCLDLLDRIIYNHCKKEVSEESEESEESKWGSFNEKVHPKGKGLAVNYISVVSDNGIGFRIPWAIATSNTSSSAAASDYGVFIPYKSFSKCIPKNSPLRSVMR